MQELSKTHRPLIWQLSRELSNPWYVIEHGGRYFINAEGLLTFQRQFSSGPWDGPEVIEDYDQCDADDVARIEYIKAALLEKI